MNEQQDLATPAVLPVSIPELGGREWTYLKECLDTGWVSTVGPFVDRFEQEVAAYVGVAETNAVAVSSGTAGLHTALQVARVQPDDEVLVSDLTFIAPVNAIRYRQAHPVFIDADPHTWQMDVEKVGRFLQEQCTVQREQYGTERECRNTRTGRRIRAILPVHILGSACDMKRIMELAKRYHLRVIEDAAEGMGVRFRGRHVGSWGHVGVLSFNGNKIMTSGGGGMLMTNTPDYADYARYLTTQAREPGVEFVHHEVGYNYRLTNLQAALGVAQLEQLNRFIVKKHAIARFYEEAFRDQAGITPMPIPPHTEPTYWLYTILLKEGTTVEGRMAFITSLRAQGIEARPLWQPIHSLQPYREAQTVDIEHAPLLHARGVQLPCSVGLEEPDQQRVVDAVTRSLTA